MVQYNPHPLSGAYSFVNPMDCEQEGPSGHVSRFCVYVTHCSVSDWDEWAVFGFAPLLVPSHL